MLRWILPLLAVTLMVAPGAISFAAPASVPETTEIPLWPGAVPDAISLPEPESSTVVQKLVGGKTWTAVMNVTKPTLRIYRPKGKDTGVTVVVFPGGGYHVLAIDLEGTEVCDWLTSAGVTCVLLKYRVPGSGPNWDPKLKKRVIPKVHTALQDAQRALSLLRHNAVEWKLNPKKIGVLGFSAGGYLVAAVSTYLERHYPSVDAADREDHLPDFAIPIYPGHLSINYKEDLTKLNPKIKVTDKAPPTFLLHAQDDPVDPVEFSLLYHAALMQAGVPVEMHLYAKGGHAFGLRPTEHPITRWPPLVETWLRTIKMIEN